MASARTPPSHPLLWVVLLIIFIIQATAFRIQRNDDAFISYRYGQNLALGRGPVFNPGERVMASTSPGHVLTSAIVYIMAGRDRLPGWMNVIGVAGWIAQAAAVAVLLRGALGPFAAAMVSLAVAAGSAESWSWVSLETDIAFALALWAITAAHEGQFTTAAALAALAGLFRPDAYLAAVLIAALWLVMSRRKGARAVVAFAALALPWPIFAWAWFGTPFPASLAAKAHRTPIGEYAWHALSHSAAVVLGRGDIFTVVAAWALAGAGTLVLMRRDRSLAVIAAWLVLHTTAYILLRPDVLYTWHLYPTAALLGILGLSAVAALVTARSRVLRFVGTGALGVLVLLYAVRTGQGVQYARAGYWAGSRSSVYESLGRFLGGRAAPGERVAALEVGTIGYYSDRLVQDRSGLVTQTGALGPDVRWYVLVAHQFKAWKDDSKWRPAEDPTWMGRPAMSSFRAGPFVAWLYRIDRP